MTEREIKSKIRDLKTRLDADHYERGVGFVPAKGSTREWILSSLETFEKMLPRAKHDDQVALYGWKSVERNA